MQLYHSQLAQLRTVPQVGEVVYFVTNSKRPIRYVCIMLATSETHEREDTQAGHSRCSGRALSNSPRICLLVFLRGAPTSVELVGWYRSVPNRSEDSSPTLMQIKREFDRL